MALAKGKVRFNLSEINPEKVRSTPQGGIRVEGVVIRTGVFRYETEGGGVVNEYLPAEELFKKDVMSTLDGAPVTNEHPNEMISPKNYKTNSIGFVQNIRQEDGRLVVADLIINDIETIHEILSGEKTELSAGYYADVIEKAGMSPDGEAFDAIQKDLVFNHCSVVTMGRCGPEVSLRLNSKGNLVPRITGDSTLFNEKLGKTTDMAGRSKRSTKNAEKKNVIKEEDGKFCVYSKDGNKQLGCHDTKEEAQKQLAAIEAEKNNSSSTEVLENEKYKNAEELLDLMAGLQERLGVSYEELVSMMSDKMDELEALFAGSEDSSEEVENEEHEDGEEEKMNSKLEERIKKEALARVNLIVAAKQLGVSELTGMEDTGELQLRIVQTTKPHMNLENRSADFIQALLEDSLNGVDFEKFWVAPEPKADKAEGKKEESGKIASSELSSKKETASTGEEKTASGTDAHGATTLNSILETVRSTKTNSSPEEHESTEDMANRLVYLKTRNLM